MRPETAARVLEAAHQLGYVPNQVAASLRTRRTHTVAVLVGSVADPLTAQLACGAEDALAAAGYMPLIRSTGGDRAGAAAVMDQIRTHHADGIILATGTALPLLAGEISICLPAVVAGTVPHAGALPTVSADYVSGIRLVMRLLARAGHHIIGCITAPGAPVGEADMAAAAASAGIVAPPCLRRTGKTLSAVEGRRCAQSILATRPPCTAIVAASDLLAAGCYRAAAEAGLACPGDISITGFGDELLADSLNPPLTTVRLPQYRVGAAAACLLLELLTDGCGTHALLMPPKLVTRLSAGPACAHER